MNVEMKASARFPDTKVAPMKMDTLDPETAFFSAAQLGRVAVVQFKHLQSDWILHLEDWRHFLVYLEMLCLEASVKVVVLVHAPGGGRHRRMAIYEQLRDQPIESGPLREFHELLDQYVLGIAVSSKFFISMHSGSMILDALLSSLACDYRIMADNTTVHNPAAKAGLIPRSTGMLLFRRGWGRTCPYDLLLSDEPLGADELFRFGLIDKVVPESQLSFRALEVAGRFAGRPAALLADVKRLVHHESRTLRDCLNIEKSVSAWARAGGRSVDADPSQ